MGSWTDCPECSGTGRRLVATPQGGVEYGSRCPYCGGLGKREVVSNQLPFGSGATGASTVGAARPATLRGCMRGGALLGSLAVGAMWVYASESWTAQELLGWAIGAALAGGAAGAVLYGAFVLLLWVMRFGVVLLVAGIAMHLLGWLDLWQVLVHLGLLVRHL